MEFAIETNDLSKRYASDVLAVDKLNLKVRTGEVYGFLGPNGAGKTTTIRMLVGLMTPTSGNAVVMGVAPGHALSQIGSMVEGPAFYPYLSARDNLRAMALYSGIKQSRVEVVLGQVDLTDRAHNKFSQFSLGMKQRLGVAAALLKEPPLLMLDEPSNGLDPQGIVEMREVVRGLGSIGHTVLLSSHQLGEVTQVCDRVGIMRKGVIVAEGTVDEIRGENGVSVTVDDKQRAGEVLTRMLGAPAVHVENGGFRLDVDKTQAIVINRTLFQAGIGVSELRSDERSLEDIFLELTEEAVPIVSVATTAAAA
jgi:ABC-type multidrug transport system ATPase subunit